MKTRRTFIMAFAFAAAISCVKENPYAADGTDNVSVTPAFVAERENYGGPGAKTVLQEDYTVLWDSDDVIAVWDGTSIYRAEDDVQIPVQALRDAGWGVGYKYAATITENSAMSGFAYSYVSGDNSADGYADISAGHELASGEGTWYLMNSNYSNNFIANVEKKQFRCWLDDDQKLPVGTFVDSRDFAVAKTQDLSQPVVFKNAVSLLEFVVPESMDGKITRFTVTPNASDEYLAGDLLIDYSGDSPKTTLWGLSEEHDALDNKNTFAALKLVPESGTVFAAGKYYAVACPGTLSAGLTVTAIFSDNKTISRSSSKPVTFNEGYVYGMGTFNETDYTVTQPSIAASVSVVSSSTASFTWTYGLTASDDIARPYTISLYEDADCQNLIVSHKIDAGLSKWNGWQPKFCFAGLESSTTYYFKVKDTESGVESAVVPATTSAFNVVEVPTTDVAAGDVILAEDFSELIGAGATVDLAVAATGTDYFTKVTGEFPDVLFEKYDAEAEASLINSKNKASLAKSRLSTWGYYTTGSSSIKVYAHPGFLKLGTKSTNTSVVTPVLSAIPDGKTATITVSVTIARQRDLGSTKAVVCYFTGELSSYALSAKPAFTSGTFQNFNITNEDEWKTYTVELSGVSAADRLIIGPAPSLGNGKARMYISDITVTVKSLEDAQ